MVEREVVLAKLSIIDRCLGRIADVQANRGATLALVDVEDITVLNLTRAAQATMDLATHVVTTEGYGLPDSVASAFTMLATHRVISQPLAERMRKMVGFRNIAVHDYQTLDPQIVQAIILHHLEDIRAFARKVVERFEVV